MTDAEIVAAYIIQMDADAVAHAAGVCADTVRRAVKAAGQPLAHCRGKQWARPLRISDAEICRRYLAGEDGPAIALAAGTTPNTIYYRLERAGIARRPAPTGRRVRGAKPP
jgi:hypothetical protein